MAKNMIRRPFPRGGIRTRLPVTIYRRSSDEFSPRSISGLALWLDASSSDLYTTDAGPVTAVASPLDIAGCQLWLDASDAASITASGGNVTAWTDKSASALSFTAAGTPVTGSHTLNGRNVIRFDNEADLLSATSVTRLGITSSYTVFAVARYTTVQTSMLMSIGRSNSPLSGFTLYYNGGLRTIEKRDAAWGTDMVVSGSIATANVALLATGTRSGTDQRIMRDGVLAGSTAGSTGDIFWNTTSVLIGNTFEGTFLGDIAEIIVYPTALTTADRARVEAYLAAKWSIAGVHAPATASSDPVGYWGDKSGNGRHAVQATAGNRPTVGSSSTAGKNAVRNNGTGTVALQVAAWPYTAGNTQFAVFNGSAINQAIYQRGSLNDEPRMAIQGGALANLNATRGGSSAAQTSSIVGYPLSQWAIGATLFNTSLGRAYRDGVYGADTTDSQTFSGDQELRLLSLPSNIYGINGGIAEFLYYDRQLTAPEVSRVAAYLSRRWGITLAPQVANADAQNWIDRVYQNGGTVSSATAAAVDTFCGAIDSAGIRDRFLRLNLFCGSFQGAFVPLFRGPSLGGTQYGNATDTNLGSPSFLITDYSESNGLQAMTAAQAAGATAATKHLNCGAVFAGLASHADSHIAADIKLHTGATYAQMPIIQVFADSVPAESYFSQHRLSLTAARTLEHISGGTSQINRASLPEGVRHFVLSSRTNLSNFSAYLNGGSAISGGSIASRSVSTTAELAPFGQWNAGPAPAYRHIMSAYSFGRGFSTGEAIAYSNAMAAFKVAMGRT